MTDGRTNGILKIADTHVTTLQETLDDMMPNHPFNENFIVNMNKNDLRALETMTSRFGKLQDLLGTKIIDMYLQSQAQPIEGLSMIDKVHKLEKLYIIDNTEIWNKLREVRNHIAHEYPDNPELAAKHLNEVYVLAPKLIAIYRKLAAQLRESIDS